MKRYESQQGVALIMVIGVISVVLVLGASLAMAMVNSQGATYDTTARSKAFNVAEAGLDLGMYSLTAGWPTATPTPSTPVNLVASPQPMFTPAADFPISSGHTDFVTVTMSPVQGKDAATYLLLQSQANVGGKSVKLQTQIVKVSEGVPSLKPGAALYTGGNLQTSGNLSLQSPVQIGAPTAGVYVNGTWDSTGNPDFTLVNAYATGAINVSSRSLATSQPYAAPALVGTFNDWFPASAITTLTQFAQAAAPPNPVGVQTTFPTTSALVPAVSIAGNLTIPSGTFNVGSLYVGGNLTLSNDTVLNVGALYVNGSVNNTGSGATLNLGTAAWVGGNFTLTGTAQLPLLVVGGSVNVTASANWGSVATGKPCLVLALGSGATALNIQGTATLYGLFAAPNGGVSMGGTCTVQGSVMSSGPVTINGTGNVVKIGYDAAVIRSIQTNVTSIAKLVPGTWAQIPAS